MNARKIIRWHNNTPPWFFAPYSASAATNTIRGFSAIRQFTAAPDIEFWANSRYSADQLHVLGAAHGRMHVVYPLSPLLAPLQAELDLAPPRPAGGDVSAIRLLFVGRFVAHKGHKHLLAAAAHLQHLYRRRVEVHLVGRSDRDMGSYGHEVKHLSQQLDVTLVDHGETTAAQLDHLYRRSDALLFLSEHEGFGLPVLEAMRLGLPVVGLRGTAVAELLKDHPLAVDRLDHEAIAHRIMAALQPAIRAGIVRWQRREVLARFIGPVVERQMLAGLHKADAAVCAEPQRDAVLETRIEAALDAAPLSRPLPAAHAAAIQAIAADPPGRFVTVRDIDGYGALLRSINATAGETLYGWTWRNGLPKRRRLFARLYRHVRRAVLSLNFGVVAGIDQANRQSQARFERLSEEIGTLREQNALILDQLKGLGGDRGLVTDRDLPARPVYPLHGRGLAPMLQSVSAEEAPARAAEKHASLGS